MDNKVTKARLSAFIQYEWIKLVSLLIVAVLLVTLTFMGIGSESRLLNNGQTFYLHYYNTNPDATVDGTKMENVKKLLGNGVFSYEVQEIAVSTSDTSTHPYWMEAGNVDMVIATHTTGNPDDDDDLSIAKTDFNYLVDNFAVHDYVTYYQKARAYAKTFLPTGVEVLDGDLGSISDDAILDKTLIDDAKVKTSFLSRSFKDNRFKTEEEKLQAIGLERARIEALFQNVNDLQKLLVERPEIFISYKKYTASYHNASESEKQAYEADYLLETEKLYGIDLSKLTCNVSGKASITDYATLLGATTAKGMVLAIFDVERHQPTLHYESLSALTAIVKATTDFLD